METKCQVIYNIARDPRVTFAFHDGATYYFLVILVSFDFFFLFIYLVLAGTNVVMRFAFGMHYMNLICEQGWIT